MIVKEGKQEGWDPCHQADIRGQGVMDDTVHKIKYQTGKDSRWGKLQHDADICRADLWGPKEARSTWRTCRTFMDDSSENVLYNKDDEASAWGYWDNNIWKPTFWLHSPQWMRPLKHWGWCVNPDNLLVTYLMGLVEMLRWHWSWSRQCYTWCPNVYLGSTLLLVCSVITGKRLTFIKLALFTYYLC